MARDENTQSWRQIENKRLNVNVYGVERTWIKNLGIEFSQQILGLGTATNGSCIMGVQLRSSSYFWKSWGCNPCGVFTVDPSSIWSLSREIFRGISSSRKSIDLE